MMIYDILGKQKSSKTEEKTVKSEGSEDDTTKINRDLDIIKRKKMNLENNRIFFGKVIRRHIHTDRDYIMACSGFEGEGKSACVVKLGLEVCKCYTRKQKEEFLINNIVYEPTTEEFMKKVNNARRYSLIIVDEAHELLYKRTYNSSERKKLNTLFSKIRKKNLVIIFCIPDFFDLDKYFRAWRIKTWIYVPIRGIAVVQKKSNSPYSEDKWEQKRNQRTIDRIEENLNKGKLLDKTQIVLAMRKLKSHGIDFSFPDFDEDIKELYLKYKEWGGSENPEEKEKRILQQKLESKNKEVRIAQALFGSGKKTEEIAQIMNISIRKTRDLIRPVREELENQRKQDKIQERDLKPRPIIL